ncbi:MAG: hypothetical protein IPG96_18135 [Proteobacteria bacterium]|nr:hypothetical protein [Pseudomonadota bacterium]
MQGFSARLGGMLVAPRATLARAAAPGARGGLPDLWALMLLLVPALRLPQLVAGAWYAIDVSPVGGLLLLLNLVARAVVLPFVASLLGGALLWWVGQGRLPARYADLAALCALPALVLQLTVNGLLLLAPESVQPLARPLVGVGGGVWFVGLLTVTARALRGAAA